MHAARYLVLGLFLAGSPCTPAAAQGPWSLFIAGGAAGFGGTSSRVAGIDTEVEQLKPSPTTRLHLGVERAFGHAGVALDASYAKAGIGGYVDGGSYTINPAMTLLDLRLFASYRVARLGDAASLRVAAGPMLQVWSGDAIVDTQTRLGGAAALTVEAAISSRFGLLASGSLGLAGSPLDQEVLAAAGPFVPANTWTRELAVGLNFRW